MRYAVAMTVFTHNHRDDRTFKRTHYIPASSRDHAEQIAQALSETATITTDGPFKHEHAYEVCGVVHGPNGVVRLSISDMEMIACEVTGTGFKIAAE